VALVPTTLEYTTLRDCQPGDLINIETDILARLVVRQLRAMSAGGAEEPAGRLSLEQLKASGFA
jgi:riboflavin synthase